MVSGHIYMILGPDMKMIHLVVLVRRTYISVFVNPTPRISVDIEDSILCDGGRTVITVDGEVITFAGTDVVYGFNVDFNSGLVSGTVPDLPEEYEPDHILEHWMFNNSDTVQVLDYDFVARIKDNRAGQPGEQVL